ncbi:fatty acyl-AMP ligase [Acetobacteraceae bacterium]|nr:fatty acyl-AMP ligase [Acetobacteraceae bacterium]
MNSITLTPTDSGLPPCYGEFSTLPEALDYAAKGKTGYNFYSGRGELIESLSYKRLREEALKIAKILIALGLKREDRLALVAENDGDFARIFYACQYAGIVPVPLPLPVAFGGREGYITTIRGMVSSCGASAIVIPDIIGSWESEILEGLDLKFGGSPKALFEKPSSENVELPVASPEDLSYIQFSSGSTRFPMGASITQRSALANTYAIGNYGLEGRPGDRGISWLPLYHDMGLVGFFLTPMVSQISVDFLPTREFARRPYIWLKLISQNRSTISYSPSFGFDLCARRGVREELDLSSWRIAGIGGDMVRPEVLKLFAETFAECGYTKKAFVPSYGMAETTLALTFAPLELGMQTDVIDLDELENNNIAKPVNPEECSRSREFVLCGYPLPAHELQVRDAKGQIVPERSVGRIFARGPSVMRGYFKRPEETKAVFDSNGWLDTGDLGYFLRGQIVITGRAKDLIITNGRNVWPQDLEWSVEHEISGVRSRDVAVFSIATDSGEDIVTAMVHCRLQDREAQEKLRGEIVALFRRLHGVDVKVVLVPPRTLPQTSSGKLSRAKAKALLVTKAVSDLSEAE